MTAPLEAPSGNEGIVVMLAMPSVAGTTREQNFIVVFDPLRWGAFTEEFSKGVLHAH